jgi:hypothetical protein
VNMDALEGRRYGAGPLFLVGLIFVLAAPLYWLHVEIQQGDIAAGYENSDLYRVVYPAYHYGFGRLREGDMPLWCARQACGMPFAANPEYGLFQPLNLVFLALPTHRAMAVHAFLCLALMGISFTLFARSMLVGYLPALLGGMAYAFCGASAAVMSHPTAANLLAWTPFTFWALRSYLERFRLSMAAAAGIGGALMLLSGADGLTLVMLLLMGCYAAVFTAFPPETAPGFGRRLMGIVTILTLAASIAAVQYVPAFFWSRDLANPSSILGNLTITAQTPTRIRDIFAQLLMAQPAKLPALGYVGTATLLLLPASIFYHYRRREVVFFASAAVAAFAALLWLDESEGWLPRGVFAFPFAFSLALLASLGADRLLVPRRANRTAPIWGPVLAVLALGGVLGVAAPSQVRGYVLVLVAVLLVFAAVRAQWLAIVSSVLVAGLLFIDLFFANVNGYRHPFIDAPECYQTHAGAIRAAQEQSLGARVLISALPLDISLPTNLGLLYPLDVAGSEGVPLTKDQAAWWRLMTTNPEQSVSPNGKGLTQDAPNKRLLNAMAVRVLLATADASLRQDFWRSSNPSAPHPYIEGDLRLSINPEALPRVSWAETALVADGTAKAAALLARPDFPIQTTCVVDRETARGIDLPQGPDKQQASLSQAPPALSVTESDDERVVIRANTPRRGIIVLADMFSPGWRATLDGRPVQILRVNGLFRGVATPTGPHVLVFEYRPAAFVVGACITVLGVVAAMAAIAFDILGNRRLR